MDLALFADDWGQLLIPAILFFGWVIRNVVQGVKTENPPPRQARPQPVRPRPRPQPQEASLPERPADELEQFLEDLGVKKKPQRKVVTSRPATQATSQTSRRPAPVRRSSPPPPPPKPVQTERVQGTVRDRHLSSKIDNRHQPELHSRLEKVHLESNISPVTSIGTEPSLAADPTMAVKKDKVLLELLRNKEQLPRTFIVGEVFGPPLALRGK